MPVASTARAKVLSIAGLALLLLAPYVHAGKAVFKHIIHALPPDVRYVLSLLAFWPTAGFNRLYCWLFPLKRRLWDRVTPSIVLGSAPFTRADVLALHSMGVRAVVNLCREFDWHSGRLYPALGIRQLRLRTIDYDIPSVRHGLEGARFLAQAEDAGESAYVHCKAGRGRSTAIVLCYLVLYRGLSPSEADAYIRKSRLHISKKWDSVTVRLCAALRKRALAVAAESRMGEGGGGDGSGGAALRSSAVSLRGIASESALSTTRPSSPHVGTLTPRGGATATTAAAASVAGGGPALGSDGGYPPTSDGLPGSSRSLRHAVEREIDLVLGSSDSSSSSSSDGSVDAYCPGPAPSAAALSELAAALAYDPELATILQQRGLVTIASSGAGTAGATSSVLRSGGGTGAPPSPGSEPKSPDSAHISVSPELLDSAQTDLVAVLSGGALADLERDDNGGNGASSSSSSSSLSGSVASSGSSHGSSSGSEPPGSPPPQAPAPGGPAQSGGAFRRGGPSGRRLEGGESAGANGMAATDGDVSETAPLVR